VDHIRAAALAATIAAAPAAALADPALWRVSDADSSIWLFGSVHMLDSSVPWRTATFEKVLSKADAVYYEMLLTPDSMATLGELVLERGFLPPGETLSHLLSEEDASRLDAVLGGLGMNRGMIDQMQPWMASLTISTTAMTLDATAGQANFETGVEMLLQAEIDDAREFGLETAAEQFDFLSSGSSEEQIAALMRAIEDLDTATGMFGALMDAWLEGDIDRIHEEVVASVGSMDAPEYEVLITDRNARWVETLGTLLDDNVRALVVVGAGHLGGPVGLPTLLEERGYAVERIDGDIVK
jgi:uncharacterized protein YbaP (TraB family)